MCLSRKYYTILYYTILIFNFAKNILLNLLTIIKSFIDVLYSLLNLFFIKLSLNIFINNSIKKFSIKELKL